MRNMIRSKYKIQKAIYSSVQELALAYLQSVQVLEENKLFIIHQISIIINNMTIILCAASVIS